MKEPGFEELKVVIVDSMPGSIDYLTGLLKQYKDVRVVASAKSTKEGIEKIVLSEPDIVFIDVDLPDRNGFELLSNIKSADYNPTTILVANSDKYALKAIKHSTFDYLLKPVKKSDLDITINRIKTMNRMKYQGLLESMLVQMTTPRILLNTKNDCIMIEPKEVMYCEADGNYSTIFLDTNKKEFVTYNLGKILEIFSKYNFIRIERSYIINKDYLDRVNKAKRICTLKKNSKIVELKISRRYMQVFSDISLV